MSNIQNNGIITLFKLGVRPTSIFITTIITLSSAILGRFFNSETVYYSICDRIFYISLSIIILQTLFQNFLLKEGSDYLNKKIEDIYKIISSKDCIIFPEQKNLINSKIENLLNSHQIRKMKVICYGTSKFGRIIDSIITRYTFIEVEIIVCSPDEVFFDLKSDKQSLKNVIEELVHAPNIKIFLSEIPPTIRASVMYGENEKSLWCSIQAYHLFLHETYKLFRGEGISPSIIADSGNEIMLLHLREIFDNEWERLKSKSNEITSEILVKRQKNNTW